MIVALVTLSSFSSVVFSAPAVDAPIYTNISTNIIERSDNLTRREPAVVLGSSNDAAVLPREAEESSSLFRRAGAGLLWGPTYIGNLKLYLTNVHTGPVGPRFPGDVPHVNFHVDKQKAGPRGGYKSVVNMHIVKYESTSTGGQCLYVWDSETNTTVFDNCFDDFSSALSEGVSAIKAFVDTLLNNADPLAYAGVIAALGAALLAALVGLGAVAVA